MDNDEHSTLKLYWVTTEDHCEDWFVIAPSPLAAEQFHETAEGYDSGEASAEEILVIPSEFNPEKGWPTDELILNLGGVFINADHPRIVKLYNKTYCEGLLEAFIREHDDISSEIDDGGKHGGKIH